MDILEAENIVTEIKSSVDGCSSRMEEIEERLRNWKIELKLLNTEIK